MSTAPARNRDRGFVHYDVQACEFKYNTFRPHSALGQATTAQPPSRAGRSIHGSPPR
jgi:transposase InsO family protein